MEPISISTRKSISRLGINHKTSIKTCLFNALFQSDSYYIYKSIHIYSKINLTLFNERNRIANVNNNLI